MKDKEKTKEQLQRELKALKERLAEFETAEIERKHVEERLRQSEEKYRMLVENIQEGVFIIQNGKLQYVNEEFARTAGYQIGEIIGRDFRNFVAPDDLEMVADRYHRRQAGENIPTEYEFRLMRKDGTKIVVNMNVGLVTYSGMVASMGILKDITESKRIEKALRDSEEKYRVLFEAAPIGIGIADLKGNILDCNQSMQEMTGFTLEELKSIGVGATYVDPDERKFLHKTLQETGSVRDWEIRLKPKDGTIYYALVNADLLELGGHKVLLTTARDITESKHIEQVLLESEERYRSLFEDSPISLWEEDSSDIKKYIDNLKSKGIKNLRTYFDKHPKEVALCASMMKVVDVNKATINLFKAKSKGDFIGGLEKIFTERSYETFKDNLIAMSEGKTTYESEDIVKTLTGDKIYISLKWILTPGNEETYSKRLVSMVDITERKRAEEEIKKYTRDLEESNRIKELFADIMHHDLLNPLNTANGFIELLKENETISRKKAYLETIEKSLVKGMELIDSAMKYSRFESLKSIELEELDLKKIIEEVIEALIQLTDNAGMVIVNRITLDLPVRANKIIEEVFSNLISNAIKYASYGKRIIVESEDKGENLQVRVIDFGEGIKESDKTLIFERFRRGGKKGVKGSGLGLAIAGKIMELHNGRIWVEDNPEGGSIFIVEIPGNLN